MSENKKIKRLQQQQAVGDAERIARSLQVAQQAVDSTTDDIQQLDRLHTRITKFMATPNNEAMHCSGQVLHADPVGVSSSEPGDGFTIDWAVIHLNKDSFDWDDFNGNKIYVGGKIDEQAYRDLMYPNVADQVLATSTRRTACSTSSAPYPRAKSVTGSHAAQRPWRPRDARNQERPDHGHGRRLGQRAQIPCSPLEPL
ncbi:hypothetical protein BC826DRAFT_44441 [Russula brevipes]|nr:hypothetical protein BC826DRAFT_44441 [Russula brevipes]